MTVRRADRLTYADLVTDFFTEIRGRGLMLSPADLDWVTRWESEGIPVEVVCRGLKAAVEHHAAKRPGARPPQRLGYYAPAVADAFRAHLERSVGGRPREEEEPA
jgi:hypothetical protein